MVTRLLDPPEPLRARLLDLGLLALRVGVGLLMALGHGWPKLSSFGELSTRFPDPIGGGPQLALALAVFAEFFCAWALVLGIFTRLAAIPLIVTMLVAAFVVHGADPFAKKELALMYLVPFLTLLLSGAGRHSLDARLSRRS